MIEITDKQTNNLSKLFYFIIICSINIFITNIT